MYFQHDFDFRSERERTNSDDVESNAAKPLGYVEHDLTLRLRRLVLLRSGFILPRSSVDLVVRNEFIPPIAELRSTLAAATGGDDGRTLYEIAKNVGVKSLRWLGANAGLMMRFCRLWSSPGPSRR